jgi:anti-anti-sigma factor
MIGPLTNGPVGVHLSIQRLDDELLVTVAGELDMASAPVVVTTLAESLPATCRRVVIDASGVVFVDVAGLRALHGRPNGWAADVEVCLRAPSPAVRRLLGLVDPNWLSPRPTPAHDEADGHAGIT